MIGGKNWLVVAIASRRSCPRAACEYISHNNTNNKKFHRIPRRPVSVPSAPGKRGRDFWGGCAGREQASWSVRAFCLRISRRPLRSWWRAKKRGANKGWTPRRPPPVQFLRWPPTPKCSAWLVFVRREPVRFQDQPFAWEGSLKNREVGATVNTFLILKD